jgi:hypothetical protein
MNYPIKPYFYAVEPKEPKEVINNEILKEEKILNDGEIIAETDTEVTRVSLELDYAGCYYESDSPSISGKISTYIKSEIPNPKYDKQLAQYKKAKEKYKADLKKYKADLKIYEEQMKEQLERSQREQYLKLKKKFEKN